MVAVEGDGVGAATALDEVVVAVVLPGLAQGDGAAPADVAGGPDTEVGDGLGGSRSSLGEGDVAGPA